MNTVRMLRAVAVLYLCALAACAAHRYKYEYEQDTSNWWMYRCGRHR